VFPSGKCQVYDDDSSYASDLTWMWLLLSAVMSSSSEGQVPLTSSCILIFLVLALSETESSIPSMHNPKANS